MNYCFVFCWLLFVVLGILWLVVCGLICTCVIVGLDLGFRVWIRVALGVLCQQLTDCLLTGLFWLGVWACASVVGLLGVSRLTLLFADCLLGVNLIACVWIPMLIDLSVSLGMLVCCWWILYLWVCWRWVCVVDFVCWVSWILTVVCFRIMCFAWLFDLGSICLFCDVFVWLCWWYGSCGLFALMFVSLCGSYCGWRLVLSSLGCFGYLNLVILLTIFCVYFVGLVVCWCCVGCRLVCVLLNSLFDCCFCLFSCYLPMLCFVWHFVGFGLMYCCYMVFVVWTFRVFSLCWFA